MKHIISVIQQKGGVGKTTLAVHLAHELQRQHLALRVVVADADPQESATKWIRRGRKNGYSGIDVVRVARDSDGKELRKELEAIDADLVIVDLPPAIESVSLRAALYAQLILVPVGASALDIEAGKAAIDVCKEALALDPSKTFLMVPSKVRLQTASGRELRSVIKAWGPVSKTAIGLRVPFADAATLGQGIGQYAPGSAAHQEIAQLTEEVTQALWRKHHDQQTALAS